MSDSSALRARLRRAFDRAAPGYDKVSQISQEIARRMIERLSLVRIPVQAMVDAGSGTGYAAKLLRQRYRSASLYALDLSEGMLRQGWRRGWRKWLSGQHRSGSPLCADMHAMPLAGASADLICSNLALHWVVDDFPEVVAEMHRVLRPGGLLIFSMCGPDTLRELRANNDERALRINAYVDMHDIGDMLMKGGFADPVMDMEYLTLTYRDVPALLRDLRAHGSVSMSDEHPSGLLSRQHLLRMEQRYERLRSDGRLPATLEVIYGHAWKPAQRSSPSGKPVIDIAPR